MRCASPIPSVPRPCAIVVFLIGLCASGAFAQQSSPADTAATAKPDTTAIARPDAAAAARPDAAAVARPDTAAAARPDTAAARAEPRRPSTYHFEGGTTTLREIAGERVLEGRQRVKITHGDVVITADRGLHYEQRRQSYLFDDVKITQNELEMQGNEGEYFGARDKAVLRGDVEMVHGEIYVECDSAVFYRATEQAWLLGHVVVVDSSTTLLADSVFYDKRLLTAEAFGNVLVRDAKEGVNLTGKHGYYYKNQGRAVMDSAPRLVVDPESDEPARADADTMVFFPDERIAKAQGRVKIIKGSMVTQCDSALVFDNRQQAELYGNPLAKQGRVSMQGDKMVLYYTEEEIERIRIIGKATITETPSDSLVVGRDSWVRGDTMTLFVRENALDSIRVAAGAESEYYPESVNRVEANYAKGDSMFFAFEEDSLTYVRMEGSASGVYRYVKLDIGQTADSLRAQADTSLTYVSFRDKAGRVEYAADQIEYYARSRNMVLSENAKVEYEGKTLLGKHITYSADLEVLDARGSPVLIEGADKLHGQEMLYDLERGAGLVDEGSTKFMDGYYRGETIAKVGDDVLKVWNSRYTTCDLKDPHYHITADRMKVYLDDKVVTGPLVLHIGETPVIALPFFAQNIRRGRRSGILRPVFEFGITSQNDRFIRNIGYYWATNDYTDFTFVGDFNEDRSLRFRVDNRYKLRYVFDGGVDFSFYRDLANNLNEWILTGDHSQTLGEKASFAARLHFVSSDQATQAVNRIDEVEDVVNRRIESTASLRKSWSSAGFSASARRTQILNVENPTTVRVSEELPNITLSIPSRTLYFGEASKSGYESTAEKVLGAIRVSPGLSGNRRSEERMTDKTQTLTANASLSASAPFKVAFLGISPQFQVSDRYERVTQDIYMPFIIDTTKTPPDTTVVRAVERSENQVNMSSGVSANTNVYGTFYARIGALRGLRHTISPAATYSYVPAMQGRPSRSIVSFSLRNAIDLKIARGRAAAAKQAGPDFVGPEGEIKSGGKVGVAGQEEGEGTGGEAGADTTAAEAGAREAGADTTAAVPEEEEQVTKLPGVLLWSLNTSLGQDPATREFTWSRITSLVNLRVLGTNISLNQTIDPYEWKVLNTSLTSSIGIQGTHPFGRAAVREDRELNVVAAADTTAQDSGVEDDEKKAGAAEEKGLPWDLSMGFSYSQSAGFDRANSTLNLGGSISITQGWKMTYRTTYDVIDRNFLGTYYSITRDLHCWQMSFSRQQLGDQWEFYFKINIKSHPEIYAEEGSRGLGGGSFTSPLGN